MFQKHLKLICCIYKTIYSTVNQENTFNVSLNHQASNKSIKLNVKMLLTYEKLFDFQYSDTKWVQSCLLNSGLNALQQSFRLDDVKRKKLQVINKAIQYNYDKRGCGAYRISQKSIVINNQSLLGWKLISSKLKGSNRIILIDIHYLPPNAANI